MNGHHKQTLFRTFDVPTDKIPRARGELEAEKREGQLRHITIRTQQDYYERKRALGVKRSQEARKRKAAK